MIFLLPAFKTADSAGHERNVRGTTNHLENRYPKHPAPERADRPEVASLTAFSRTGRTAPDSGARAGHPAACDLQFLDCGARAGHLALIYGSEDWASNASKRRLSVAVEPGRVEQAFLRAAMGRLA
jgi:hypothetical protein